MVGKAGVGFCDEAVYNCLASALTVIAKRSN